MVWFLQCGIKFTAFGLNDRFWGGVREFASEVAMIRHFTSTSWKPRE